MKRLTAAELMNEYEDQHKRRLATYYAKVTEKRDDI